MPSLHWNVHAVHLAGEVRHLLLGLHMELLESNGNAVDRLLAGKRNDQIVVSPVRSQPIRLRAPGFALRVVLGQRNFARARIDA